MDSAFEKKPEDHIKTGNRLVAGLYMLEYEITR